MLNPYKHLDHLIVNPSLGWSPVEILFTVYSFLLYWAELLKEEDEVKLQHGVLQLMMFVETLDGGSRTSTKPPASVLAISADMDG